MAQRHTATSPEQRRLPRNGRYRTAVRLAYVGQVIDDKTGELMYGEIKDADGELIQPRASRRVRRRVAWDTRLHGAPRMRFPVRVLGKMSTTITPTVDDAELRKLGLV